MARPPKQEETWYQKAAELMIRESCSLRQAALELDVPLTSQEAENLSRTKRFQQILWGERQRYYAELGADPTSSKTTLAGQLMLLAQKLIEQGDFDKAADVLFKLAKVQNWVGGEGNVNIFGQLSAEDLQKVRESLKQNGESSEHQPSAERAGKVTVN